MESGKKIFYKGQLLIKFLVTESDIIVTVTGTGAANEVNTILSKKCITQCGNPEHSKFDHPPEEFEVIVNLEVGPEDSSESSDESKSESKPSVSTEKAQVEETSESKDEVDLINLDSSFDSDTESATEFETDRE